MAIVTPSDVEQLQAVIRSQRDQLTATFQGCPGAQNDPTVAAQWAAESLAVDAFLAQDASWIHTAAQMDAGQALQQDLSSWVDRFNACGCKNVPAKPAGPPPDALTNATKLVGTVATTAIVLAAVYVGVKLIRK